MDERDKRSFVLGADVNEENGLFPIASEGLLAVGGKKPSTVEGYSVYPTADDDTMAAAVLAWDAQLVVLRCKRAIYAFPEVALDVSKKRSGLTVERQFRVLSDVPHIPLWWCTRILSLRIVRSHCFCRQSPPTEGHASHETLGSTVDTISATVPKGFWTHFSQFQRVGVLGS